MNNSRFGHSSSSRAGLSGSIDDSSVVSLKTLVARSNSTLSTAKDTSSDDSGLIDLKKLMANAPPSSDALPPVLAPSEAGLFAMHEATPLPYVSDASDASKEAHARRPRARAKWLAAATVLVVAAAGTMGFLHTRAVPVGDVQRGVAAAAALAATDPNRFVAEPKAVETASNIAEALPAATESPVPASTPRHRRQAAARSPSRNQTRPEPTTTSNKGTVKAPPPAPCDLMCEMQRATKK